MVERIRPDGFGFVCLLQLGGNDFKVRPPSLMSLWNWKSWLPCWGRNTRESTIKMASLFGRRRTRRNGLIHFFLKFVALSRWRKAIPPPTNSLQRNTLTWILMKTCFEHTIIYPFGWHCDAQLQLFPAGSDRFLDGIKTFNPM